jgi:predicted DNA binding CopG/RHH family protein
MRKNKKTLKEITVYDKEDTSGFVDTSKSLKLEDLGINLPVQPPTQVVSIRLPTALLNELRALGSEQDVPYQALIKLILRKEVTKMRKKSV